MDLISMIARTVVVMDERRSSLHNQTSGHRGEKSAIQRDIVTPKSRRHNDLTRRHSVADFNTNQNQQSNNFKPLQRTNSSTSVTELRQISWSEYTARRSLVKFRNRRTASQRSRDQITGVPPSHMARRVLSNQYEVCRDNDTTISERIMAVFYCWFFGWITDVYNTLTGVGTEPSFFKWFLSCSLVTVASIALIALISLLMQGLLIMLQALLYSANAFLTFISVIFVFSLGTITVCSYSHRNTYSVTNTSPVSAFKM